MEKKDSNVFASVEEKRSSLIESERKLGVGRREATDIRPEAKLNWKAIILGLVLAVVVVVLVVILFIVIGKDTAFAL